MLDPNIWLWLIIFHGLLEQGDCSNILNTIKNIISNIKQNWYFYSISIKIFKYVLVMMREEAMGEVDRREDFFVVVRAS